MDPITHTAAGALAALVAKPRFRDARFFTPFCLLVASLPDADVFIPADPEWELLHHRGLTTSFIGIALLALIAAGIYRFISPKTPFRRTYILSYAIMLGHIWLDLITSYGTLILAPFSNHRYALDGAFIIDPILTGAMLLCIGIACWKKQNRTRIAIAGILFTLALPAFNMFIGKQVRDAYAEKLDATGKTYVSINATPEPFTPIYYKIVVDLGSQYELTTVSPLFPDRVYPARLYDKPEEGLLPELGKQHSMFNTWAWFARWEYMETSVTESETIYAFGDLRFDSTNPVFRAIFDGERKPPFMLKAFLNAQNRLTRWSISWNPDEPYVQVME